MLSKYYIITIKGAALKGLQANSARGTLKVANGDYKIISILDCHLVAIKEIYNGLATCIY